MFRQREKEDAQQRTGKKRRVYIRYIAWYVYNMTTGEWNVARESKIIENKSNKMQVAPLLNLGDEKKYQ